MLEPLGKRGLELIKRGYVFVESLLERLFRVFINKRLERREIPLALKCHGMLMGVESATHRRINGFYKESLTSTITEEISEGHTFQHSIKRLREVHNVKDTTASATHGENKR